MSGHDMQRHVKSIVRYIFTYHRRCLRINPGEGQRAKTARPTRSWGVDEERVSAGQVCHSCTNPLPLVALNIDLRNIDRYHLQLTLMPNNI
jgi:hypothetical protein